MGKIIQKAKVINYQNFLANDFSKIIEPEFLIDTGAAMLCLRKKEIESLKLQKRFEKKAVTANGVVTRPIYSAVDVEVDERHFVCEVMEIPDDAPPLMGYLVLEGLDLIADTSAQKLVGNPMHGGKYMVDLL